MENIFWTQDAPPGEYKVAVDMYGGPVPVDYSLTVTLGKRFRRFDYQFTKVKEHHVLATVTVPKKNDPIAENFVNPHHEVSDLATGAEV